MHSRLGFPTVASGRVSLTLNTIHQVTTGWKRHVTVHTHPTVYSGKLTDIQAKAFLLGGGEAGGRSQRRKLLMDRLSSATLFSRSLFMFPCQLHLVLLLLLLLMLTLLPQCKHSAGGLQEGQGEDGSCH